MVFEWLNPLTVGMMYFLNTAKVQNKLPTRPANT
jgi:hypothetical protein